MEILCIFIIHRSAADINGSCGSNRLIQMIQMQSICIRGVRPANYCKSRVRKTSETNRQRGDETRNTCDSHWLSSQSKLRVQSVFTSDRRMLLEIAASPRP